MANFTPGPWRKGIWGSVVSDHPTKCGVLGSDDVSYYGGHLIAESVAPQNIPILAAAPDMYAALASAISFLEIALRTSIVYKSTRKGGHDGDGNSWSECAGVPEWRARQMLDEWTAALAKAGRQ